MPEKILRDGATIYELMDNPTPGLRRPTKVNAWSASVQTQGDNNAEAIASTIQLALNSHDALIEALELMTSYRRVHIGKVLHVANDNELWCTECHASRPWTKGEDGSLEHVDDCWVCDAYKELQQAEAALKAARGEG